MSEQQQRDELAKLLFVTDNSAAADVEAEWRAAGGQQLAYIYAMADALIAAGYRKNRTISAAEELEALPVQSVIRGKFTAEKWADEEGELWYVAGKGMRWDTEQLVQRGALPATVLFEGAVA